MVLIIPQRDPINVQLYQYSWSAYCVLPDLHTRSPTFYSQSLPSKLGLSSLLLI